MVRLADTAYGIETYNIHDDGQPERLLQLEGWFFSNQGIAGMQLALPGVAIPISEFRLPSFGLVPRFGDGAAGSRFRLETRFDDKLPPLGQGRLLILLANGDGMTVEIASMLTRSEGAREAEFPAADRALVMRFEGLGDNCEFGLMQRRVGHERLSLLRYGGAREVSRLIDAIGHGFEGFGTPEDLTMTLFGDEWIAISRRYGFTFHTGLHADAVDEEGARTAESSKLVFMANMLVEDLESCSKVFVRRVDEGETLAGMEALYEALRAKGPATLLWVTRAEADKPHGRIEHVTGDLYRGYHGSLADYSDAYGFDPEAWVTLLRRAEAVIAGEADAVEVGATTAVPEAADAHPESHSWRTLTSGESPDVAAAPEPGSGPGTGAEPAGAPEPEPNGFWSRVMGRR